MRIELVERVFLTQREYDQLQDTAKVVRMINAKSTNEDLKKTLTELHNSIINLVRDYVFIDSNAN